MSDTATATLPSSAPGAPALGDARLAEEHALDDRVDQEQARLVLERTRVSTWAGLPAALLIVWLLSPHLPPTLLGAWFCAKLAVLGARVWIDTRARRDLTARQPLWAGRFQWMLAADGLLFGMLAWVLLPPGLQLGPVIVATLVAIASIGTVVLSVSWRPCMAFVLPILLPATVLQLLGEGRIAMYLGGGIAVYLVLLVLEVRKSDAHTRAMLRLRFQMDRLAAERQAALEQALRSDAAKGQFLATMSHEMRTPLHGILGLAQELQRGSLDAAGRTQHLQTLVRTGDHLLGIINDVLDHSKIESGHLQLAPQDFDLDALLNNLLALEAVAAAERGLSLDLQVRLPVPCLLHGDPVRLRQVLLNLLGNALKFTDAGGVTLRATALGDATVEGSDSGRSALRLVIEVIDTGPGIPAAERGRIFDAFRQLDSSWSRRKGGTGLGLTISRELVHAMGGQLECIEPEGGRGAAFRLCLTLPRVAVPACGPEPAEAPSASDAAPALPGAPGAPGVPLSPGTARAGHVLLAEDNEVNAMVARAMLERAGLTVSHALDGLEAVALATSAAPDLILMDCQMPGIDGFEATRRIRHAEAGTGRAPVTIVALTANALDGDRERCLAAGMDGHLGKPFDEAALLALVRHHVPSMARCA